MIVDGLPFLSADISILDLVLFAIEIHEHNEILSSINSIKAHLNRIEVHLNRVEMKIDI